MGGFNLMQIVVNRNWPVEITWKDEIIIFELKKYLKTLETKSFERKEPSKIKANSKNT